MTKLPMLNPKPLVQKNLQKFFTKRKVTFAISKDESIKLPLVAWDSINICNAQDCPIGIDRCPYGRRQIERILSTKTEQKCLVQAKYLRLVYQNLITSTTKRAGKLMDEHTMSEIGLLLLPLYGHLIKFKLIEASLGYKQILTTKGGVNQIYFAIQKTIQAIRETSKDVLPQRAQQKAALQCLDVNAVINNSSYYDRLEQSAQQTYELSSDMKRV